MTMFRLKRLRSFTKKNRVQMDSIFLGGALSTKFEMYFSVSSSNEFHSEDYVACSLLPMTNGFSRFNSIPSIWACMTASS